MRKGCSQVGLLELNAFGVSEPRPPRSSSQHSQGCRSQPRVQKLGGSPGSRSPLFYPLHYPPWTRNLCYQPTDTGPLVPPTPSPPNDQHSPQNVTLQAFPLENPHPLPTATCRCRWSDATSWEMAEPWHIPELFLQHLWGRGWRRQA